MFHLQNQRTQTYQQRLGTSSIHPGVFLPALEITGSQRTLTVRI